MRRSTVTALILASLTAMPVHAGQAAPETGWGGSVDGRWYAGSYAPGGWAAYRAPEAGVELPRYWIEPGFEVRDPARYRLPAAETGRRWLRYYDDAVLVGDDGRVIDARTGIDWNNPAAMKAAPVALFAPAAPMRAIAPAPAPAPASAPVVARAPAAPGATYAPPPARPAAVAAPATVLAEAPPPRPGPVAPPRGYPRPAAAPVRADRGSGGAAIGAGAGAVAGGLIAGRGDRLGGALIGAGVGAVAGLAIDRAEDRGRAPRDDDADYPPWDDDDRAGYRDWRSDEIDLPPSVPPQVQVTGNGCTTRTVEVRPAYVARGWYFPATFETTVTCGG